MPNTMAIATSDTPLASTVSSPALDMNRRETNRQLRLRRRHLSEIATTERTTTSQSSACPCQYVALCSRWPCFAFTKMLEASRPKCTLCLSVTILVTHVLYLIANCFTVPPLLCLISAILLHYGFLSTFFWTSVLSYDIWRGVTAMKLYSTRRKTLALYGALAWGLPLAIVSAAFTVNWTTPDSELSPGYGRLGCWIGTFYGLITYFLVPMATLLLFCLCLYLRTICYIRNTALAAGSLREPAEDTSEDGLQRKQQRSHMSLFARLALIMGATWAIAFIGIFVPSVAFDIITNALVGCQGLYLFLAFKDYRYFCSCVQKRTSLTPLNGSPGTSHSDLASSKKSSRSKST
ncbi:hypothetical protein HPB48_015140 [Haemaphysalis longicornis]|uniref:G-protein coupled receptors family 2 profile 2 domain-containing protein n=1 Tax=Haemaphysalis longicornis TaxID=44386 RepID=A0A9J6GWR3_HAELO|nr:hypothetical protein HPB48_015140 [Haemaphysalis longicornis]